MSLLLRKLSLLVCLLVSIPLVGCGSSSTNILVNFTAGNGVVNGDPSADPFLDTSVTDVVFVVASVATPADVTDASGNVVIPAGTILDENGDTAPDSLVFPSTCDLSLVAGCGTPNSSASFNINDLPLNISYNLTMQFRDAVGGLVYQGTVAFDNIETLTSLTITVIKL